MRERAEVSMRCVGLSHRKRATHANANRNIVRSGAHFINNFFRFDSIRGGMSVSLAPSNTYIAANTPMAPDHLCIVINFDFILCFRCRHTEHRRVPKETE